MEKEDDEDKNPTLLVFMAILKESLREERIIELVIDISNSSLRYEI